MPRELSAVKIPEKVVNNSHQDSVRWTAIDKNGEEVGQWSRSACYAGIMSNLGSYEIHCRPYWKRGGRYGDYRGYGSRPRVSTADQAEDDERRDKATSLLPGSLYKDFWKFCKEAGLVPEEVEITVKNQQNLLVIPRLGWDRHTVYTILSLYRHCDCQPRMPATAVLLYRKLREQGVHFLQCLHYAMADLDHPFTGHVFILMGESDGCYYGNHGARNLAASLAMVRFARMPMKERKALGNGMTYAMFCQLANDLNPVQAGRRRNTYSAQPTTGIGRPQYMLRSKESLLLPKFAPLYENPDLAPKEFAKAMEGECE
jgi:hypothetical protein